MLIIGLTGGIGSGKSAAAAIFEEQGICVVDADIVARQVVEPGTPALRAIAKHFGDIILQSDGSLDRPRLRQIIFQNPEEKSWLEALLHPIIRTETQRQLKNSRSPYSVLCSPLLFETDQHQLVDRSLLIDATIDTQIARTCARDQNSEHQVRAIIASQASRQEKQAKADDIIVNESDLDYLRTQTMMFHQRYLELARTHH